MSQLLSNVPFFSMRGLTNFLQKQGVALERQLALLGCDKDALNQNLVSFTTDDYQRLQRFGQTETGIKNLGFQHGKNCYLGEWGLLGHIVMASENLLQALEFQRRYQCLMSALGYAYHEQQEQQVVMRWLSAPNTDPNITEQVITAWVSFAFTHTISQQKPLSVHFVHAPLADTQEYLDFFGCEVVFNAQFNGVIIDPSSLQLPLTNSNKEVLNVLCGHAENQLAEKKSNAAMVIIQQFVTEQLPHQVPSLQDIAAHLGITTRQVQRKFQKEGTNLTELLEQIRKNLAIAYLSQTDHKLIYIARMLGYSEQSAFQRAFKRWTGHTPQDFRLNPKVV